MKIKIIIGVIFVIFIAILGNNLLGKNFNAEKKYNLILISFDGLQSKHLKSYGYNIGTTPNLDNFLMTSSLFTKTVSPSSWTVPTHMSIFTSMYPSEHKVINKFSDFDLKTQKGVIANLKKLSPNAITLAEILKNNGYVTGGFTGDAGVGPQFGFGQGFDTYFETETFGGLEGSAPKAIEWLKENKDKPFFLFLHGYDVHGQHEPKEGFDYRYVAKPYSGKFTGSKVEQGKLREEALANGGNLEIKDEDIAFWRAIYDEKINRNDLEFKKFMDQIGEMNLDKNTIIIVMSDHGTEFFEHNSIDHGATLYGELIDTLMAIHQPNQRKGQSIDQLVSTMDLMPTILDLLKIENPVPQQTKGINLVPALSGKEVSHDVFSETDYRLYTFKRSIRTVDGWKFILSLENGKKELYDLNTDPLEKNNLILSNPQKGFELETILRQHIERTSSLRSGEDLGCSPVYGDQCKK
ncbi:MAG TPA: sulfatase [Candidatus Methanoperedens sp.]|nr:sulfatase [Candidatus Methanoperedens sp.]